MSIIRPFKGIRPRADLASAIAALPYDVYNSEEAREIVAAEPKSFLQIDRAETLLPKGTNPYSEAVYKTASETLNRMIDEGSFLQDKEPCYYLYALTMNGRTQTGLVGCASIDDYCNNVILKHENTLEAKEQDRIRHIDACSAQTGPIFLAYRADKKLGEIIKNVRLTPEVYDFTSDDGIRHEVWRIDKMSTIVDISKIFEAIPHLYIADGHHRAASAVKVGLKRRAEDLHFSGTEEYNYFLSVLFPADELAIYDYNRVVTDMNGYTFEQFLDTIKSRFDVALAGVEAVRPQKKGEFGMYADGNWYRVNAKADLFSGDPVKDLDVSVLQDHILSPVLGISDPRTDSRIRFIGGIRGLDALKDAADQTGGQVLRCLLEKIIQYELLIPRIDVEVKEDLIADKVYGRWQSLEEWFTGTDGKDSEAAKVFDTTNEIIRKITRYAARISEMSNAGANRREEYHKVAVMFSKCKNIFEAHRLAAVVFGIEKPLHLKGLPWRQTESINSGVFEEEPYIVTVTPRIRTYKEKAKRSGIVDRSKEKEEMWLATIQRLEEERRLLKSYIQDNRLEFAKLPEIEPHVRDVFLTWLSKALENKSLQGKTEDGQVYRVEKSDTEEICILKSSDGNLQMPAYVIVFEKNE